MKKHHIAKNPKLISILALACGFGLALVLQVSYEKTILANSGKMKSQGLKKWTDSYGELSSRATSRGWKYDSKKKPVLLVNFWASWCKPCLVEFSAFKKIIKKYSYLEVLGVNQDDSVRSMKKAIKKNRLNFFSFHDDQMSLSDSLGVEDFPYSVLYCRGKVEAVYPGLIDFAKTDIEQKIKRCREKT